MFPLRDHQKSGKTPWLTYTIIAVNVVVFLFNLTMSETDLGLFYYKFALVPLFITSGDRLYTLITHMFLHGSIMHLLGNMLFLNVFGDNLEATLGRWKYLLYYIGGGLAGSLLQMAFNPDSIIPNLGASGAIAGLMGGYLVLFPKHRIDVLFMGSYTARKSTVPAYFMLFYWVAAQFLYGIGSLSYIQADVGGTAYFAHFGGFVVGAVVLLPFKKRLIKTSNGPPTGIEKHRFEGK